MSKVSLTIDIISDSTDHHLLHLKFDDTGYGIPEEDLSEIFNRFHRVKDKNTREIHGTGLGLAIARALIDGLKHDVLANDTDADGTVDATTVTIIADVTNGSTLPLRIRPGAPTSAIDIAAGGLHPFF